MHLHNLRHNVAKDNLLNKFFGYFLVLDVKRDFERFLGSTGLLVEGALLGLTSISSSDSASMLLMLLVLAVDVLVELTKKERISAMACYQMKTVCSTKVHSRSVYPQKNGRNYLITRSIKKISTPHRPSLQHRSFDIYISIVGPKNTS